MWKTLFYLDFPILFNVFFTHFINIFQWYKKSKNINAFSTENKPIFHSFLYTFPHKKVQILKLHFLYFFYKLLYLCVCVFNCFYVYLNSVAGVHNRGVVAGENNSYFFKGFICKLSYYVTSYVPCI